MYLYKTLTKNIYNICNLKAEDPRVCIAYVCSYSFNLTFANLDVKLQTYS